MILAAHEGVQIRWDWKASSFIRTVPLRSPRVLKLALLAFPACFRRFKSRMYLLPISSLLLALSLPFITIAYPSQNPLEPRASFPDLPFTTNGRDIISKSGAKVVYAGVNWPGAADTMLPEGLQYASIATIVSKIKSLGMNVIRLTYAIQMVDDIINNAPNQNLQGTLTQALGTQNGNAVLAKILAKNPTFTASTTRLQVFDAVAAECARQGIWVHLDNHMSKAAWCCSETDGNAWFGGRVDPGRGL